MLIARIQFAATFVMPLLVLMAGCSAPLFERANSGTVRPMSISHSADNPSPKPSPTPPALPEESSEVPSVVAAREEAMGKVLDQLDHIRQIDSDAQQRLLADLRQHKTDDWPLLVSQFYNSLKYRKQLTQDDTISSPDQGGRKVDHHGQPVTTPGKLTSDQSEAPESEPSGFATTTAESNLEYEISRPLGPAELTKKTDDSVPMLDPLLRDDTPSALSTNTMAAVDERAPKVSSAKYLEVESALAIQPVSSEIQRPISRSLPPIDGDESVRQDWHQHVEAALEMLDSQAAEPEALEAPALHQVRQKLLQMVAGQIDDATLPITSAMPHEQRYWSEQLLALSTLTTGNGTFDEDRRASLAAEHLSEALAHLRDLSNLTVHNLEFCEQVFDFGAYKQHADNRFRPSQKVTLYAEVENYTSELTDEGYHTWLASRYEVLDDQGRRIDGGDFPDVEDTCHNRRRDFHIQYALPLPKRSKPGQYRLQLTIEDRLSGKEGTNVIEFDLVAP